MQPVQENSVPLAPSYHFHRCRITRRLVWTLALLPIVPAATAITEQLANSFGWIAPQADLRWTHGAFAAYWTIGFLLVWRSMIVWTLGRSALTSVISVVPFIQVILAQPLWNAGCFSNDVLQWGQHSVCAGIYPWLAVWAWWGLERGIMKRSENRSGTRMPITAQCIVRSIGSIPFVFGVWLILAIALDKTKLSQPWKITLTFEFAAVVAVIAWTFIWRRVVRERERMTSQVIASAVPMQ